MSVISNQSSSVLGFHISLQCAFHVRSLIVFALRDINMNKRPNKHETKDEATRGTRQKSYDKISQADS